MLRRIYEELVIIRKELQAIRSNLEPDESTDDGQEAANVMSLVNSMIKNVTAHRKDEAS